MVPKASLRFCPRLIRLGRIPQQRGYNDVDMVTDQRSRLSPGGKKPELRALCLESGETTAEAVKDQPDRSVLGLRSRGEN